MQKADPEPKPKPNPEALSFDPIPTEAGTLTQEGFDKDGASFQIHVDLPAGILIDEEYAALALWYHTEWKRLNRENEVLFRALSDYQQSSDEFVEWVSKDMVEYLGSSWWEEHDFTIGLVSGIGLVSIVVGLILGLTL